MLVGLVAAGYWWLYPIMWLLPLATWYQLVSRIRNIAEHAVVPDDDDPLRNTRTTYASPVERLLLAPYWVNYHLEHHLFMFVPCWRLKWNCNRAIGQFKTTSRLVDAGGGGGDEAHAPNRNAVATTASNFFSITLPLRPQLMAEKILLRIDAR